MDTTAELETTICDMVQAGKGILAADESAPTIAKRLSGVTATEERELTPRKATEGNLSVVLSQSSRCLYTAVANRR